MIYDEKILEIIHSKDSNTVLKKCEQVTDVYYDIAMEAIEKGISHITHTFNAMTPLHHRSPGIVGAAFHTSIRHHESWMLRR